MSERAGGRVSRASQEEGMNYRHQFHAGNFADVMKHALLLQLVRGMQRKEKGFLYLDTHAGRGSYDLERAAKGDSLERTPEHPDGIGRLQGAAEESLSTPVREYVKAVREFDAMFGGTAGALRYYPGSPWIVRAAKRPQDRLVLCEKQPDEFLALGSEFAREPGVSVHELDGYTAIRAMLPPVERRALVLIDPPFESQNEYAQIVDGLREGLKRMPAATFAVWHPLTVRARSEAFFDRLMQLDLPPTLAAELTIAGEDSILKMKGSGLVVLNPPWGLDGEISATLRDLASRLAQASGAEGRLRWLVPE